MADVVADVVGERPDSEGQFVGVLGIAEEVDNEVARADVVGKVGEERVAEGIVTDVLNDAACIGVGACLFQFFRSEVGIAAAQQGRDGTLPGQVDQLLVGKEGISAGGAGDEQDNRRSSVDGRTLEKLRIGNSIAEAITRCSKGELQRSLQDSRSRGADDISKSRTADIAVDRGGAIELRVVENVECLHAEEQGFRFCERQPLGDSHVEVVRPRAIEESPLGSARSAKRIHAEDSPYRNSCSRFSADYRSGEADRRCSRVHRCSRY